MKIKTRDLLVGGAVLFGAWYIVNKGRETAGKIATAVNPADRENIFYQGTGEWGTGIADWFGGLFKSSAERKVDAMLNTVDKVPLPQASDTTSMTGAGKVTNSWDTYGLL